MNSKELINWLLENGGPIIRYKTVTELALDQTNFDVKKLRSVSFDIFILNKLSYLTKWSAPHIRH